MASRKIKVAKTATVALKILWEEGFFRGWKKKAAIVERLAKRGSNFSGAELGMALKRAKHLTRRGSSGTYEYIQKYPFVAEKSVSDAREKG
ncbi:MAG: hypothetical protein ACRD35_02055 [Candidatus Acidiferrales bacterium]